MLFFSFLLTSALSFAQTAELELHGGAEVISGSHAQAERLSFKARGSWEKENIRLFTEAYAEADFAERAEMRRAEETLWVQEAYFDTNIGNWFIRAGRQPVRWSEAWLVPSLDVWTARRWNRFLFDPVSEQLIHPAGLRVTYVSQNFEIDTFQNFSPPVDEYPEPFPKSGQDTDYEWGLKPKYKYGNLEISGLFADQVQHQHLGVAASYAFDLFVAKYESGRIQFDDREEDESFHSAGVDIFSGPWTLLLQATYWHQTTYPTQKSDQFLNYLSLRWEQDSHAVELQAFNNARTKEEFYASSYTFHINSAADIAVMAQTYGGSDGTLFGLYENHTGDFVAGIKFIGHYSL